MSYSISDLKSHVHTRRDLPGASRMSTEPILTQHKVTVLLIDDQPMIGEAVRRMLVGRARHRLSL